MIQIKDVQRLVSLMKKGEGNKRGLELRDGLTLFALIAKADWTTGQIPVTAEVLAEMTDQTSSDMRRSLARLVEQNMLRRVRPSKGEGTGFFYAINPWMIEFGKEKARGLLTSQFVEA